FFLFFFSSRRRHTRSDRDWSSDVCSSDLGSVPLFIACVAIWGSTWIAITYQLGSVAPEASVSYRFLLAAVLLFAYCKARALPLRSEERRVGKGARSGGAAAGCEEKGEALN